MQMGTPEGQSAFEEFKAKVESMTDQELRDADAQHRMTTQIAGDELHLFKGGALEAAMQARFGLSNAYRP